MAQKYKAELYVIHSIYNPFSLRGWSVGTLSLKKEYERILADTRQQLSELVKLERKKGMSITELVREGEPTMEILKTIEAEQIDLYIRTIIHGEGRLEDLLFNRSNDELVRKMPCSIMLVKKEAKGLAEEDEDDIEDEDDVEEKLST
ncbi:universal stress protein [Thermodesulfobacteriota bacterium]